MCLFYVFIKSNLIKMKNLRHLILISSILLFISSCSKDKDEVENPESENIVTQMITPQGGTINAPDDIQLIFPQGSVNTNTEVKVGYTNNENFIIENGSAKVIGKPFTIKIKIDTLQQSFKIRMLKPVGYIQNKTAIVASVNPKIPLEFEDDGLHIIASFDNLTLQAIESILNNSNTVREIVIGFVVDNQLPMDVELGLKEVTIDNTGKMIFSNLSNISTNDKILLMVHGWTSSPSSCWEEFLAKIQPQILQASYTKFITFGYYSGLSINNNGAVLANQIQNQLNGATIDIVAHSMGGLVSRSAIENYNMSIYIRNLITLGTPHKGSKKADLRQLVGRLFKISNAYFNQSIDMGTQGMKDLQTNSLFIQDLIDNQQPTTNYYPIAAKSIINGEVFNQDGVVSTESALATPNNNAGENNGIVFSFNVPLPTNANSFYQAIHIPHIKLTSEDIIIAHVAEKLNEFNSQETLPTYDLVAYYPFNGNANDESGNNNNGIIYGEATLTNDRHGLANKAYNFDGVNDYINIQSSSSLESPTTAITISAWIKPTDIDNKGAYFLCKNSTGNLDPFQYRMLVGSDKNFHLGFKYSSSEYTGFNHLISINNNEWIYLASTFDGNTVKFYVNGNLVGQQNYNGSIFPDSKSLDIGRDAHGPIEWMKGSIDDVRIYRRALSSDEIQTLYNE